MFMDGEQPHATPKISLNNNLDFQQTSLKQYTAHLLQKDNEFSVTLYLVILNVK